MNNETLSHIGTGFLFGSLVLLAAFSFNREVFNAILIVALGMGAVILSFFSVVFLWFLVSKGFEFLLDWVTGE
jgi:hypothetical protein